MKFIGIGVCLIVIATSIGGLHDQKPGFWGLTVAQGDWIAIVCAVIGAIWLAARIGR